MSRGIFVEDLRSFITDKKNIVNLLVLGILLLGLPLGTQLIRHQQLLRSFASGEPIQFAGPNVENRNGTLITKKPDVSLILTSSLGPKSGGAAAQSAYIQTKLVTTAYAECGDMQNAGYREIRDGQDCNVLTDGCNNWDFNDCKSQCNWFDAGYPEEHNGQNCEVWTDGCNNWDWKNCSGGGGSSKIPDGEQGCCSNDSNCQNGQSCSLSNGACQGEYSCDPNSGGGGGQQCGNYYDAGYPEEHNGQNCEVWTDGCNNWDFRNCSGGGGGGASSCDPNGGIVPPGYSNSWTFVGDNICDDNNRGYSGQKWQCGSTSKWADDHPDTNCGYCERSQQLCADASGQYGIMWCTSNSCTGDAGCFTNGTGNTQSTSCTSEHPSGPGSSNSACWRDGGYISRKSANDGCVNNYGAGSTCSENTGSNTHSDGCTLTTPQGGTTVAPPRTTVTLPPGTTVAPPRTTVTLPPGTTVTPPRTTVTLPPGTPTPPPITGTVAFRIANSPVDLLTASWQDYVAYPTMLNWQLDTSSARGPRTVWVEYKDAQGNTRKESASITLIGDPPIITGTACDVDINTGNLNFKVNGTNFDVATGDLTTPTTALKLLDWKDTQVIAILESPGKVTKGQPFSITLTRNDGEKIEGSCSVGTSQLSLGAKIFCRAPSDKDQVGVDLTIVDSATAGAKIKQKVTINSAGVVQGLKTTLEEGKTYKLSIKASKSLRKGATFIASAGTSVIPNFNLPIGDILPVGGDDVINSMDYAELKRQWIITAAPSTPRSGDFNSDSRINSFDYACMKYDFGKSSDPEL